MPCVFHHLAASISPWRATTRRSLRRRSKSIGCSLLLTVSAICALVWIGPAYSADAPRLFPSVSKLSKESDPLCGQSSVHPTTRRVGSNARSASLDCRLRPDLDREVAVGRHAKPVSTLSEQGFWSNSPERPNFVYPTRAPYATFRPATCSAPGSPPTPTSPTCAPPSSRSGGGRRIQYRHTGRFEMPDIASHHRKAVLQCRSAPSWPRNPDRRHHQPAADKSSARIRSR